ncbi:MAG TPA: DUF2842 domain-containing protein [Enterovirga sp.]|jgi:uncharacterized membrane protein YuzA (DUF378 family)
MQRRLRKLVGTLTIFVFVIFYALVAMALAESRIVDAPKLIQTIFYIVLGLAWILPIMPLIRWMERPDEA